MPKHKKPAAGRAHDFDPRYASARKHRPGESSWGTPASGKPGSKSPKHRGYRPEADDTSGTPGAPGKKKRWSAQEKAGRSEARGIRTHAHGDRAGRAGADRGDRSYEARPARGFGERPARSGGDDRAFRSGDTRSSRYGGDRAARSDRQFRGDSRSDRGDRAVRPSGDRPFRSGDRAFRGDRMPRSDRPFRSDGGDRSFRDGDRAGRPSGRSYDARRAGGEDRGSRGHGDGSARGDRPFRSGEERPARPYGERRDERAGRPDRGAGRDRAGRGDRAVRSDRFDWADRDGRGASSDRADRFGDEGRGHDRDPRGFDDRPRREDGDGRDDRPRREDGDGRDDRAGRDRREYSRGHDLERATFRAARPPRSFDSRSGGAGDADRPARRGDRPSFGAGERPYRDDRPRREDRRPDRSDWTSRPQRDADELDVVHERLQAEAVDAATVAEASFAELGLGANLVKALAELGAATPFPIQAATIPPILQGRDVLARGRTGSGKTIAFGAPLVESILRAQAGQRREFGRSPKALVLAPTRELALQIDRTIQALARSVGLFTTQVYGGVPQARQVGALRKGVDIVIGTPGRIEDLQEQGRLDLSEVQLVVLDEADHMSELGFLEPMQRILRLVADGAQKLMFSATLDREVAALVDEFLVEPAVYEVAGEDQDSGTIDHRVLVIDHRDKAEILASLVDRDDKTLVFTRTRAYAEMLAEQFEDVGIPTVALHGDLNQAKRTRNLQRLTDGRVRVLVATDVAARGIHVDDIGLVVQADPPDEYKTYLHRSGRTGRAGREGRVVTLITRPRRRRMTELLDRAEIEAPFDEVRPGDDLLEEIAGRQVDPVA
ncbi:DEAD/DEAH box helicase [Microbacterium sp.]|uniref:DEAD/DEAH box helicase n=1 Tax=Microbacterium sp. TaxID=51671 RepID=UPI0039E6A09B